jgi:hypothetical protein
VHVCVPCCCLLVQWYLASDLWYDRTESFWSLLYGHTANYAGRGTFTATEQLPIYDDSQGVSRDYLWSYLEGGIDECVPSVMMTGLGTAMQLVLERFGERLINYDLRKPLDSQLSLMTPRAHVTDNDTVWLGMGAPARWAAAGYGVTGAITRFGVVSFHANASSTGTAMASVSFSATGSPGVASTPTFVVRLKGAQIGGSLDVSSVTVSGQAVLVSVDASALLVTVNLSGSPVAANLGDRGVAELGSQTGIKGYSFSVSATIVPPASA